MILLFLSLFIPLNAQDTNCRSISLNSLPHNLIVFGQFTGRGSTEGTMVVQGDFNASQIDIATLGVSDDDLFALFVGGTLTLQCGIANGDLLHLGNINLGPGVDLGQYAQQPLSHNDLYDFSGSQSQFSTICEEMQQVQSVSEVELRGDNLILTGHNDPTELFNVNCGTQLNQASVLRFMDISAHDATTIIINLQGPDCEINFDQLDVHGLGFVSPGGHVIWTHCPGPNVDAQLIVNGYVVGSILAPSSTLTIDGYVEGQVIVDDMDGTVYSSRQLFRGCIPTDRCALVRRHCEFQRPAVQCPNAVETVDPENPCCSIWECPENVCDGVVCPATDIVCNQQSEIVAVIGEAGQDGHDPCCDTWGCVPTNPPVDEPPFVSNCPDDIVIQTVPGQTEVLVTWDSPQFLFTRSVTCSHTSPLSLQVGDSVYASCLGQGLMEDTLAGCMWEINIKPWNEPTSCNSGGVSYDEGEWFFDSCNRKCLCDDGEATLCRRVRLPLLQMTDRQKEHYFRVFKTVYNDPDRQIRSFVNDHVQMFSRGLHNNGAFLPWHRGYILATENELRKEDCTVTVPYWDQQTQPRLRDNNIWGQAAHHASHNGRSPDRCVMTGTFGMENGFELTNGRCLRRRITGGQAATVTYVAAQIYDRYPQASQYDQMRNRLEHGPGLHDSVHCIVGGTMCSARSSNDPVFFSHHANTDRIWWVWQAKSNDHLLAYRGNTGIDSLMPVSPYTPREMLDLMCQGQDCIAVNYWTDDAYDRLESLVGQMTAEESSLIPTSGTTVTASAFFFDMNMGDDQREAIQEAERLQQSRDIREAVALTLENAVERASGSPNLAQAIQAVTNRLAVNRVADEVGGDAAITAQQLWLALAQTMIQNDVVPPFSEIQEIIHVDENDEVIDVEVISVERSCVGLDEPVCANGQEFPNMCEAETRGYNSWTMGNCPSVTLPEPLDEETDGGASLEYNHEIQELSECPETQPRRFSSCQVEGTVCYYGIQCCNIFKTTMTCGFSGLALAWQENTQAWNSCDELSCTGENIETRAPTPNPTRAPTDAPTRRPTRAPTRNPTRAPTRPHTVPPPVRPQPRPRPPPARPPPQPRPPVRHQQFSTVSSNDRGSRSRVTVRPSRPTPPRPQPQPIVIDPCPRINRAQCPIVRCCAPGATLTARPTINGCDQNCPACMMNGRPTMVPTCCRGPEIACIPLVCPGPQELVIIQPAGANHRNPCCPRYRCGCPPNHECSLDDTVCSAPNMRARWALDGSMDAGGCCRRAECVTSVCDSQLTLHCSNGETHEPDWELGCVVEPCPLICPDEGMLTCPVSRSIHPSGLISRGRDGPFVRNNVVVCPWLPCPDYEPCDDTQYDLEQRNCHHNGECVRGLNSFRCQCNDDHEGPFCQNRIVPPRLVLPIRDRSAGFNPETCSLFLCQEVGVGQECFVLHNLDNLAWDQANTQVKMSSLTDGVRAMLTEDVVPVQFVGQKGDDSWFLNPQGNPVKFGDATTSNQNTDAEFDAIVNGNSDDFFSVPAVTEYSYLEAKPSPPQVSEYRFVRKGGNGCGVWVYFTDTAVGLYFKDYFHKIPWGPNVQSNYEEEMGTTQLVSEVGVEICENKCLNDDNVLELCNENGICNPETGDCMCDFGYFGDKCEGAPDLSN